MEDTDIATNNDRDEDRKREDSRDQTRFLDLTRNEIWGSAATHGPNSSGFYGVASGSYTGRAHNGTERTDTAIFEDVNEALSNNPDVDASLIEIEVEGRVVTLSGQVQTQRMRRLAEETVENLQGVKDVKNRLHLDPDAAAEDKV